MCCYAQHLRQVSYMLSVMNKPFILNVIMVSDIMLSVMNKPFMLNVIMVRDIMLSLMAPLIRARAYRGQL
jgi:hypothetical protein